MKIADNILQELQEVAPALITCMGQATYTIPPDYFNQLPFEIMAEIQLQAFKQENNIQPFTIPNSYFDGLSKDILSKIKSQNSNNSAVFNELETIAPLLNSIDKQPPNAIPDGYFNKLEVNTTNTKVVPFRSVARFVNYAAAAMIVGILSVGTVQYLKTIPNTTNFEKEIAKTSVDEIHHYLESQPNIEFSVVIPLIDEPENNNFLEAASEEEIQHYLQQNENTTLDNKES
jgi:hypothetical protein